MDYLTQKILTKLILSENDKRNFIKSYIKHSDDLQDLKQVIYSNFPEYIDFFEKAILLKWLTLKN